MSFRGFLASCIPLALVALPTLSASCTQTANIDDVYMSLDGDGSRRRSTFYTDSTQIHCIGEGGFGRPNVDVESYIRQIRAFDGTNFVPVDSIAGYADVHPQVGGQGAPPTKIDLEFKRVDKNGQQSDSAPFPVGSFTCDYLVDGKVEKTVAFNIEFAPCPPIRITPLSACTGFYAGGTQCPRGGIGTNPAATCTCDDVKGWVCGQ